MPCCVNQKKFVPRIGFRRTRTRWLFELRRFRSIAQEHGTTEHTEHTEARDNGGRIRFRVFGVFCGSKRQGIAAEAYRSMRLLPMELRFFNAFRS